MCWCCWVPRTGPASIFVHPNRFWDAPTLHCQHGPVSTSTLLCLLVQTMILCCAVGRRKSLHGLLEILLWAPLEGNDLVKKWKCPYSWRKIRRMELGKLPAPALWHQICQKRQVLHCEGMNKKGQVWWKNTTQGVQSRKYKSGNEMQWNDSALMWRQTVA